MLIAVLGSADAAPEFVAAAEVIGRELARRGATVVCGGRGGVMEAACKGAREAGGHTIAILPGYDAAEANPYVEFAIPTGLGHARNTVVALTGRAIIAIDGAYGTLSEIAFALIYGTPVIGLGTWELDGAPIIKASNPVDAVEKALEAAAIRQAKSPIVIPSEREESPRPLGTRLRRGDPSLPSE